MIVCKNCGCPEDTHKFPNMCKKFEPKFKDYLLEDLCTFTDECVASNYGAFPVCSRNYIDCKYYQKIIAEKLEEYNQKELKGGKRT